MAFDLGSIVIGGFRTGMGLAERWEETRRIVEDREQRRRAEVDYQRTLDEKVRPLRAVRQALWADMSSTQASYADAVQNAKGGDLTELARVQAEYDGKMRTHLTTALEIQAAEENAWHEYASADMNPYRAEQAKREIGALLDVEKRFATAIQASAGQFEPLIKATASERKLGLEERKTAAYERQVADAGTGGGGGSGGGGTSEKALRQAAIDERLRAGDSPAQVYDWLKGRGEGGERPMPAASRAKVLKDIESELSAIEAMPTEESLAPLAARLREEQGIEIDPKQAAADPALRARLLDAERGRRIMERGEDVGDESLIQTGARRLDRVRERIPPKQEGDAGGGGQLTVKDIAEKLKNVNTMTADELDAADGLLEKAEHTARVRASKEPGQSERYFDDPRAKAIAKKREQVRKRREQLEKERRSAEGAELDAQLDELAK